MRGERVALVSPIKTKSAEIGEDLLYPKPIDRRFIGLTPVTIFQKQGTVLEPQGDQLVVLGATYATIDRIIGNRGLTREALEAAETEAQRLTNGIMCAQYFENLLGLVLDHPVDLKHITVELIGEFAVHTFGYDFVPVTRPTEEVSGNTFNSYLG